MFPDQLMRLKMKNAFRQVPKITIYIVSAILFNANIESQVLLVNYYVSMYFILNLSKLYQARPLVGSTLLAREGDRPELEDGEFYTRDLVGMRVVMKVCTYCATVFHYSAKCNNILLK